MLLSPEQSQSLNSFTSTSCKAANIVSEAVDFYSYRQSLNSARILVVDNHVDTCDLFSLVLEEAGAEVITATSCEKALLQIQKNPPDILISEIELPDESGFTLIRKAKELMSKAGQTPFALAVTSYTDSKEQLEIYSAGFHRCLSKPVDIYELVDVVAGLIEQKQNS